MLIGLLERIENFFKRLESYTELPPSRVMTDTMLKITVEVLSILAIATTEIKESPRSELIVDSHLLSTDVHGEKYLKKLLGRSDVEDALKRLDNLTQEEAQMATAEVLKVTRGVDNKVNEVINGACCGFNLFFCGALNLDDTSWTNDATDSKWVKDDDTRTGIRRRSNQAFVLPSRHYRYLSVLSHPHREPDPARPSKVALSTRSLDKSQHHPQSPLRGHDNMVLTGGYFQRVEVGSFALVDPR